MILTLILCGVTGMSEILACEFGLFRLFFRCFPHSHGAKLILPGLVFVAKASRRWLGVRQRFQDILGRNGVQLQPARDGKE